MKTSTIKILEAIIFLYAFFLQKFSLHNQCPIYFCLLQLNHLVQWEQNISGRKHPWPGGRKCPSPWAALLSLVYISNHLLFYNLHVVEVYVFAFMLEKKHYIFTSHWMEMKCCFQIFPHTNSHQLPNSSQVMLIYYWASVWIKMWINALALLLVSREALCQDIQGRNFITEKLCLLGIGNVSLISFNIYWMIVKKFTKPFDQKICCLEKVNHFSS